MLTRGGIALADFYTERPLSSSRAHNFRWNDLLDQFCLAKTLQPGSGENDCVIFPLFEFAEPRINIAAQRMNVEIGTNGFELSLTAKAGCTHASAVWEILNFGIKPCT